MVLQNGKQELYTGGAQALTSEPMGRSDVHVTHPRELKLLASIPMNHH